jgi:cytochrome c oxidase assembly protein subunit 11
MAQQEKKQKRLIKILAMVPFVMFGFGFALVPLYNTLCKALGINGKTSVVAAEVSKPGSIDKNRWVTVEFMAMNANGVPWKFGPSIKKVKVHPGEMKRLSFYAENFSEKPMVVQAIPSVTPGIAAKYFKKTECFCFTQQQLSAHEAMDMPLLFHLDPELPKEVNTVTLSYTLFDVTNRYGLKK